MRAVARADEVEDRQKQVAPQRGERHQQAQAEPNTTAMPNRAHEPDTRHDMLGRSPPEYCVKVICCSASKTLAGPESAPHRPIQADRCSHQVQQHREGDHAQAAYRPRDLRVHCALRSGRRRRCGRVGSLPRSHERCIALDEASRELRVVDARCEPLRGRFRENSVRPIAKPARRFVGPHSARPSGQSGCARRRGEGRRGTLDCARRSRTR